MKKLYPKVHIPEQVSVLWMTIALAVVAGLGASLLQINQLRNLYQSEVATSTSIQESYNKVLEAKGFHLVPGAGTIRYSAKATPLVVNAPDSYRFLIKTDSVSKRISLTEIELISRTDDDTMLTSQPEFGSINIRAHEDVFSSQDTTEWVRNELANQIDTTQLTEEVRVGDTWLVLTEPNVFSGHKITYFLLKNGVGYRVVFYQLGSFEAFTQKVHDLMGGIAILQ